MRVAALGVAVLVVAAMAATAWAQFPAGTTAAVLSFIDADGGHVSVNRHWYGAGGQDTQVYPFTPYFWNSCLPGDGAIMTLITSPVGYPPPGLTSSGAYTTQFLDKLSQQITQGLQSASQSQSDPKLQQMIAGMRTPGNPAYEALKVGLGQVNTLNYYEDYGYATFLMIRWEWKWPFPGCYPTIVTVPEGYGIPFVSLVQQQQGDQQVAATQPFLPLPTAGTWVRRR
ncbi:MAG TPA: hypothetical protein VKZ50_04015 [bacterium]|nr:hypothetical protein [bacterium]